MNFSSAVHKKVDYLKYLESKFKTVQNCNEFSELRKKSRG